MKVIIDDVVYIPCYQAPFIGNKVNPEKWADEKAAFDRDEIIEFKTPCSNVEKPGYEYRIEPKPVKKWQWAYKDNIGDWKITGLHFTESEAIVILQCPISRELPHKLKFTEIEVDE